VVVGLALAVLLPMVLLGIGSAAGPDRPRSDRYVATLAPLLLPQRGPLVAAPAPSPTPAPRPIAASGTPTPLACQFAGGFAELAEVLGPEFVGTCLEPERPDHAARVIRQRTTIGEFVWFRDSGTTAFTDGPTTWYRCPTGFEGRLSDERPPC
jgi:hypothetical protein